MSEAKTEYDLSLAEIRNIIRYNPDTGELFRLSNANPNDKLYKYRKFKRGDVIGSAGTKDANGYIKVSIKGTGVPYIKGHRLAWALHYGEFPSDAIDHINGIRDDNRIENLRIAPNGINSKNMKKPINNKSGKVGVSWSNKRKSWRATIWNKNKQICLGYYKDKSDAIKSREEAEIKYKYHKNHGRR
jgi:hypothetical protein